MKKPPILILLCVLATLAVAEPDRTIGPPAVRGEMPNWQVLPDGSLVIIHRGVRTGVDSDGEYEYFAEEDVIFDTIDLLNRENPGLLESFKTYMTEHLRGNNYNRLYEESGLRTLVSARKVGQVDLAAFSELPVVWGIVATTEDEVIHARLECSVSACHDCGNAGNPCGDGACAPGQCVQGCYDVGSSCDVIVVQPRPIIKE